MEGSASCPGAYKGKLGWLSNRANQIRGAGGSSSPATGLLVVDQHFGPASVGRLQQVLGTVQDRVISGQPSTTKPYHVRLNAVQYGSGGSTVVRALQRKLGVTPDRYLGPNTIRAWQQKLGVTPDKYFGPNTAGAAQKALNKGRVW